MAAFQQGRVSNAFYLQKKYFDLYVTSAYNGTGNGHSRTATGPTKIDADLGNWLHTSKKQWISCKGYLG